MQNFIQQLPKAELHCHIEGTLEPEMLFQLADRNKIKLPYRDADEVRRAYQFQDLQSFLDLYHQGCEALMTEQDFYDLTWAYFSKIHQQSVKHAEIFFVPQCHTERGVRFETVFHGIKQALNDAQKKLGVSSHLILCFNRHLSEQQAFEDLEMALPFKEHIIAVGLESTEKNQPADKFQRVYTKAREQGFLAVAHAGEEGPAENIWQALKALQAKRIDHGVRCLEDMTLVDYLKQHQIPLTVCPISNIKLCVFKSMHDHPIKKFLDMGLCVTINSDDPAYFGGYINDNYLAVQQTFNLTKADLAKFAINSFNASFLPDAEKKQFCAQIAAFIR